MNRPASTYVIIAHFTASGDFSQTKRGKKKSEEKGRARETAHGDQGTSPSKPCKQWYLSNSKMAFQNQADYISVFIPAPLLHTFLPNTYLETIDNLTRWIQTPRWHKFWRSTFRSLFLGGVSGLFWHYRFDSLNWTSGHDSNIFE